MKIITLILASFLFLTGCEGVTGSENTTDSKWEYLMVSFGKTKFSDPEKMLAYKNVGLQDGNESVDIQSNLDILGRFGWEVIGIVGSIGGDQAVVLKRKYDKERSANEYGLIQSEKITYLKEFNDIIERSARIKEQENNKPKPKPELVDLDEIEREKNRLKEREQLKRLLEDSYRKKFESTELSKNSTFVFGYENSYSKAIVITIVSDLTDRFLINGNSYHGDEIGSYLTNFLSKYKERHSALTKSIDTKYSSISIHLEGSIKFKGEMITVWTRVVSQSHMTRPWKDEYGNEF